MRELQQYRVVEMKLLAQQRDLQRLNSYHKIATEGRIPAQYQTIEIWTVENWLLLVHSTQAKIPDIEKCLDIVATLQAKKDSSEVQHIHGEASRYLEIPRALVIKALIVDFKVSEGIYSRARIEDAESVCLWLGANVMLQLLPFFKTNLENAKASLEVLVADLQFLRDQVTITQVTTARVYNWDVHQRRLRQATTPKES
ncbi:hypothetical protein RND71_025992 [Anisodus tanguticus]|uniref:Prefoldin subunit 3 n=1 Tax=Anisodus tanguticus TaxID=243964 RepID=A0AAE1V2F9_9SOLA|nr:hypothetical protein RND71_025992 [Anisodus tanguticus]